MRHIILHNHLFKNAGTSVDHILAQNFDDRWLSAEFPMPDNGNTALVREWICDHPQAVAFSSNTLMGPLPVIADVAIIPIVMLRDPVDRIASAYRFERAQKTDTWAARLAKSEAFAGYVHGRLSVEGDRQCRNFQTQRLASLMAEGTGSELERACAAAGLIRQTGVLGFVPEFAQAMKRLNQLAKPHYPGFSWRPVAANVSGSSPMQAVSPAMRQTLQDINADDLALLAHANQLTDYSTVENA